jgi:hypothetical protein
LVLQVVGLPTEVIGRLPPVVNELTLRPAISSLKLPKAVVGTSPAIKLSPAGAQAGVNGVAPNWLVVETTRAAWAELAKINTATKTKFAATFDFMLCRCLMMKLMRLMGECLSVMLGSSLRWNEKVDDKQKVRLAHPLKW